MLAVKVSEVIEFFEEKPLIGISLSEIEKEVDKVFERRRAIISVVPAHLERRKLNERG
jgi:hypothetical protein